VIRKKPPLFGSLSGLPPAAVFTSTGDLLNSDARRLKMKMKVKTEGFALEYYEYKELFHVWVAAPIPEAKKALEEVAAFVRPRTTN
jgi:acetyl esterase/lipase